MTPPSSNSICHPETLQTSSILLKSALHELAQPLTVLAALLDEAVQASEPAVTSYYVALARGECCRAVAAMQTLQVHSMLNYASGDAKGLL